MRNHCNGTCQTLETRKKPSLLSGTAAARFSHVRPHIHVDDGIKPMHTVMTSPGSGISKYGLCLLLHTFPAQSFGQFCSVTGYMAIGLLKREYCANLECVCLSLPNLLAV